MPSVMLLLMFYTFSVLRSIHADNIPSSESLTEPYLITIARTGNLPLLHQTLETISSADVNSVNSQGNTALLAAVLAGNYWSSQALLSAGANPNIKNKASLSAILVASYKNYTDLAIALINNNAKVNVKQSDGMTPLLFACKNGNFKLLQALINSGANLNTRKMQSGENCLHLSILSGNMMIVRFLLSTTELDINLPTERYKMTPLMYAVEQERLDIVKCLLEYNPDLLAVDFIGNDVFYRAAAAKDVTIASYLRKYAFSSFK